MGEPKPHLSVQHLSMMDSDLHMERVSSKVLLEASEALAQDVSWVSFTEQWSTRHKTALRDRKSALSPVPSVRQRRTSVQRSHRTRPALKVSVPASFEDVVQSYGGVTTTRTRALPCLPLMNVSSVRSRQTSEEQLLNSPPVLHHVRLQPSIRTPGRQRLPQAPGIRIKRRLFINGLMRYSSKRQSSYDFDPNIGVGMVTGRRFQGSPGRGSPL